MLVISLLLEAFLGRLSENGWVLGEDEIPLSSCLFAAVGGV